MKKLSQINEGWGSLVRRDLTGEVREEDKRIFHPHNRVELIDAIKYLYPHYKDETNMNLTRIDVSNIDDMYGLFKNFTKLEYLNISNWDMKNVKNMQDMFCSCENLKKVNTIDWEMSNMTHNMAYMFADCSSLESLDVSNWNISGLKNASLMFKNCKSLKTLDVSNWDVSNISNAYAMFFGCSSLESLDVSNWNMAYCSDIDEMFDDCDSLKNIDFSNWNIKSANKHYDILFRCGGKAYTKYNNKLVEYVMEGWGSLVRRDLTGEVRDEDKNTPEYKVLHNPEWVDMDGDDYVLWANCNVGAEHPYEVGTMIKDLPQNGVNLVPHDSRYNYLMFKCKKIVGKCNGIDGVYFQSNKTENYLFFPINKPNDTIEMGVKKYIGDGRYDGRFSFSSKIETTLEGPIDDPVSVRLITIKKR